MTRIIAGIALSLLFVAAPQLVMAQGTSSIDQMFEQELNQVLGKEISIEDETRRTKTVEELLSYLASPDELVRYEAEQLLKKLARPQDLSRLLRALSDNSPRPDSQVAIVNAIGVLGDSIALTSLKREYSYGKKEVQLAILNALGNIKDDTIVSFLSDALQNSKDDDLEQAAIRSLTKIGDERAKYTLESSFSSMTAGPTKITAQWALDGLKGKRDLARTDHDFFQGKPQVLFYKGMQYHYFRPTTLQRDERNPWLIACIHGEDLRPDETFQTCLGLAKQYRVALVTPFFDPMTFPEYENLNIHGERADKRLFELVDFLAAENGITAREIYFFGHGKGGEFVERLTLAYPERVARSAFYTAKYMNLDPEVYYPFGLKTAPIAKDLRFDLNRIIKTDFAILVDPKVAAGKSYKTFYAQTLDFAESNEMSSRVRPRILSSSTMTLQKLWDEAAKYLFSTCS